MMKPSGASARSNSMSTRKGSMRSLWTSLIHDGFKWATDARNLAIQIRHVHGLAVPTAYRRDAGLPSTPVTRRCPLGELSTDHPRPPRHVGYLCAPGRLPPSAG